MKLLIFGIDGLGQQSLEALRLTKLKKRLNEASTANPAIDNIVSRGWPELYSGEDAYKTGAFYQIPVVKDGKIVKSQKTGLNVVKSHMGEDKILWNALSRLGYKCGVFCVPTASSTEELNGFFVAVKGAGKFGNQLEASDFYPKDLFKDTDLSGVDLGFRMGYGAFIPSSIKDFKINADKHLDNYFLLLNKSIKNQKIDACFAASRIVNELAYKFIKLCMDNPQSEYEKELRNAVLDVAEKFDTKLDEFIDNVSLEHLFIVSDHGLGVYDYDVNINEILYRCGYIKRDSFKNYIKTVAHPIMKKAFRKKGGKFFPKYQLGNAECFSIGFTDLIYINDERFTGPSLSNKDVYDKANLITSKLNQYAKDKYGESVITFEALNTEKYTTPLVGEDYKVPLPNIRCFLPNGYTNLERTNKKCIQKHFADFSPQLFKKGFNGEHSGCKTDDTLASYQGTLSEYVNLESLTSIYNSILTIAGQHER